MRLQVLCMRPQWVAPGTRGPEPAAPGCVAESALGEPQSPEPGTRGPGCWASTRSSTPARSRPPPATSPRSRWRSSADPGAATAPRRTGCPPITGPQCPRSAYPRAVLLSDRDIRAEASTGRVVLEPYDDTMVRLVRNFMIEKTGDGAQRYRPTASMRRNNLRPQLPRRSKAVMLSKARRILRKVWDTPNEACKRCGHNYVQFEPNLPSDTHLICLTVTRLQDGKCDTRRGRLRDF